MLGDLKESTVGYQNISWLRTVIRKCSFFVFIVLVTAPLCTNMRAPSPSSDAGRPTVTDAGRNSEDSAATAVKDAAQKVAVLTLSTIKY